MFGLSLIRLGIYAFVVLGLVGSLYTGYRVWRHSVWVEGRNAALEAVKKVNEEAAKAASRVQLTTDQCFDQGGTWDVVEGKCNVDISTPAGISRLFAE